MRKVFILVFILLFFSGCSVSQEKKEGVKIKIISIGEVDGTPVYGNYMEGPAEIYNDEMIVYPEYPEEISDYLEEFKKSLEPVSDVNWIDSARVSAKRSSFSVNENTNGTICFVPKMYEVYFSLTKQNGGGDIYFAYIPKLLENGDCEGVFRFKFANESDDISVFKSGEYLEDMVYVFPEEVKHIELQFYQPDPNKEWHAFSGLALNECDSFTLYGTGISESAAHKDLESFIFYYQANPVLIKQPLEFKVDLEEKSQVRINMRFLEEPYKINNKELLLGYIVFYNGEYVISDWNETIYTQNILPDDTDIQIIAVCMRLYYENSY